MTFDQAFEFVFLEEGGYVNDPNDSGGETKHGISKRSHPNLDIKNLTKETVRPIYYDYWKKVKADLLPEQLRLQVFDFGFNAGTVTSIKLLQRLCQVKQDGKIGQITLGAAKELSAFDFCGGRINYYHNLAKRRPKDRKFLKGWIARSNRALNYTLNQLS
jgi:lysozyme family protein